MNKAYSTYELIDMPYNCTYNDQIEDIDLGITVVDIDSIQYNANLTSINIQCPFARLHGQYNGNSNLVRLNMPKTAVIDDATGMYENVFSDNMSLTAIELPDAMVLAGNGCLSGCAALKELDLNAVSCLGSAWSEDANAGCLAGCTSLVRVVGRSVVEVKCRGVFAGDEELRSVEFPAMKLVVLEAAIVQRELFGLGYAEDRQVNVKVAEGDFVFKYSAAVDKWWRVSPKQLTLSDASQKYMLPGYVDGLVYAEMQPIDMSNGITEIVRD